MQATAEQTKIYIQNCSVYIECKNYIVIVNIKQHKTQFSNSDFTQLAKFFCHCLMVMFELSNCNLWCFISTTTMPPLHCL